VVLYFLISALVCYLADYVLSLIVFIYFALSFPEANDNVTHYLHFAVKFFPVNPTSIKNDLTR
jgi:hypothetical protein